MKHITSIACAVALALSCTTLGLAQQAAKHTEQKHTAAPTAASAGHKATTQQTNTAANTAAVPLNKDEIMALQNALIKAKAYSGKVNGMLDPATTSALMHYQKSNKLKATGEPDAETLHKLGVAYSASAAKPMGQTTAHAADVKKQEAGKKPQGKE